MLRHVRRELPAEDVTSCPTTRVVGGVDQDEPRGAVEQVVQIREVVVIIREVEEYVHAERQFGGPLPARSQGFVRRGEDELPEEFAVPVQDRGGHVHSGIRHVWRVLRAHRQEFQDLAVSAPPVDDTRDVVCLND